MKIFQLVIRGLSSFGFAVILLLFLLVIVFLGTLYQVDHGLFQAQEKYFNSAFVVHHFFGKVPVTLPGGYLLMALFTLNLVVGGIIRMKKNKRTLGIMIGHVGMIVMMAGGFVTYHYSDSGNMQLYEGQTSNEFVSYYDWTIEVANPNETDMQYIVDQDLFLDLEGTRSRTFSNPEWPFDLTVSGYARNAWPLRAEGGEGGRVADGFRLEALPSEIESEQNVPGAYISVKDKATGTESAGIIWGMSTQPFVVRSGEESWMIDLARKRWKVPFTVTLDDFVRELHPGTDMPASFESFITKSEQGQPDEKIHIFMNHPLRYHGYTFFQASWGPSNARPGEPLFSVFAVVRNPADQVPLVACIIVGIGLTLHFGQRLYKYLQLESKRREA